MDPIVREILEAELDEARAEIELQAAEMGRLQRELESRMGFHRRARERSVALEEALRDAGS